MRIRPHSIRQRVLSSMLVVVVLSGIGFMVVLNLVVRGSFSELEEAGMRRDASRVRSALDSSVVWVQAVAGDWARWTDSYEFLAGENPGYPEENLDAASMTVLGVDFMAYLDREGKMFHISALDPETRELIEASPELVRRIETLYASCYAAGDGSSPKAGHVMLPGGPASIVFHGITSSDGTAPCNGVLVTGVYFGASEVVGVERITALDLELLPPRVRADETGRQERLDDVYVTVTPSAILSHSTMRGIDGRPALTYSISEPRSAMEMATSTIGLVGLGMLGVVVLSSLTMVWALDKMVNQRLTRLHEQVSALPSLGVSDRRVTVEGDDEIADIARALNVNFEGLAEAEAALKHAADHDYLTGLANRRRFEQDVEKALSELDRTGGTLAWLLMDLDGFKEINDTRGHHCGDTVLVWFARLLESEIRRYSTIARLGGDEFAVLLPHSDEYDAAVVADRLLTTLSDISCDACDGEPFMLNASVGIAVAPHDGTAVGELSRAADNAMYHTKVARVRDERGTV